MIDANNLRLNIENAIDEHDVEEDKIGRTKLTQVADIINSLPTRDTLRAQAADIVTELLNQAGELSTISIRNLLHFVELSMIDKREIFKKVEGLIRAKQTPITNPKSRAELIRFLLENDIHLPAYITINDQGILAEDKWLWIDRSTIL